MIRYAWANDFNPSFTTAPRPAVLDGADALVIFTDGETDWRPYSWAAGKRGLAVKVVPVPTRVEDANTDAAVMQFTAFETGGVW